MRQARKKGLLNDKDKRLRLSYAREMKRVLREHPDYYTNYVAFYLDAVSFVHKNDPRKGGSSTKKKKRGRACRWQTPSRSCSRRLGQGYHPQRGVR